MNADHSPADTTPSGVGMDTPAEPGMSAVADFAPGQPNQARIYDYLLGGKNHYPADRAAAERLISYAPGVRELARANRDFLVRAVAQLSHLGIRQYVDVGSGLPGPNPIHEVVRAYIPDARVVYCDTDQLVLTHNAALVDDPITLTVPADLRDPPAVAQESACLIDWNEPIALSLLAVLHFLSDADDPYRVLRWFRVKLPPGSHIVFSHVTPGDLDADAVDAARSVYEASGGAFPRSQEEIERMCEGLTLLRPGLVQVGDWRPDLAAVLSLPQLIPPANYMRSGTLGGLCAVGKVIRPVDRRPRDLDVPRHTRSGP